MADMDETTETQKHRKNGLTRASELPKRQYIKRRPTGLQQAKLDAIRERIQTDHIVMRLQANTLADKEFMSPGKLKGQQRYCSLGQCLHYRA